MSEPQMTPSRTLREFVAGRTRGWPPDGARGVETDWIAVGEFNLRGNRIYAVDATMPFPENAIVAAVPPGTYRVQGKAADFAGDIRVSRLRAFLSGSEPVMAEVIGEALTDVALLAICDIDEIEAADSALEGDEAGVGQRIIDMDIIGAEVVTLPVGAKSMTLVVSESGFGDGGYPVYALREGGCIVGVEVEFLGPDALGH